VDDEGEAAGMVGGGAGPGIRPCDGDCVGAWACAAGWEGLVRLGGVYACVVGRGARGVGG